MIEIKKVNGETFKVANGTFYHANTNDEVIRVLENSLMNNKRIRIFYGDTETGRDWMEIYDTIGTIGRSCGQNKIPLLIKNSRSYGGGAILTHCIVKITIDKEVVYKHPKYYLPTMEIKEASATLKADGYFYSVFADGKNTYNCKTLKQAENEVAFHKGLRNKIA